LFAAALLRLSLSFFAVLTSDFDYNLPPELIAAHPLAERSASRMLVVDRARGTLEHRRFSDISGLSRPGDLWVLNNTRVVPARFFSNDGRQEVLRLDVLGPRSWRCMVKPGKRFRPGHQMVIGEAVGTVLEVLDNGDRMLEFDRAVDEERHGHLALPPYMERQDEAVDRERYQTVYAQSAGAIAAPTAGLHFTPEILAQLAHAFVTLHVGAGTFQPVKVERIADHVMHRERYEIPAATADAIAAAGRVIAVGTTSMRTLEAVAREHGGVKAVTDSTDIFIYPGYEFRVCGALLTNFHLPKSTLLMLVSAFAGSDLIRAAYAEAVRERYRFFSYGDCMLIV
jgi:S-adenosylmethionine:tRNA ribosyltransferase-isomerase